ncbi:MAG: glutathione synthase [Thiomonas arsenitoxydans]|uniref:Glutathione synthetase n=1 Tax=Thiomonas arsenitoxydans (strain DSM 22701 / CIP 110005 / 3As) TaxID=426114 RepID=A0A8I1MVA3_THIA3|nr:MULTISPECIES: glutathione synthase [Thiomonas]MBN8744138.1 glutathione synthase [Thiomonas arsenitoxydans]ODU98322.1 MAG: glutathione synthase [Thiomonas sp. SCN 64-16]
MQLLFIADPIASFKIYKDTTFAMMREAQARGHVLWVCEAADLHWRGGASTPTLSTAQEGESAPPAPPPRSGGGWEGEIAAPVTAVCRRIELTGATSGHDWYRVLDQRPLALREVDAVLMRKDPPFDSEYFYATHLLQQAEREGAAVFNSPRALRDHPEKLAILEFPQFITPTLVSRRAAEIKAFYGEHGDIILKPLDGMGGTGIFRLRQQADGSPDPNLNVVIETLTAFGATTVMAQRFVPAIAQGDKRVLIIDGEPVPYCLARIPQGGETRGNLAAGGLGVAQPLSETDWAIARALGPVLAARGLLLVGIDIIGDKLTEINVTSPTCFQEITQQSGCDVAARFISALEAAVTRSRPD